MIECIMAWLCLVAGFLNNNPLYYIASGAFAIACQIESWKEEVKVSEKV